MYSDKRGFTLVEIMVVVAIISLLVSIAMPSFMLARMRAQNTRYINDLRVISQAFEQYVAEHGSYPADTYPGLQPPEMATYLNSTPMTAPTPLGGQWDWDFNYNYRAALSTMAPTAPDSQLLMVDEKIDDGNLQTGSLVKSGSRISLILEP